MGAGKTGRAIELPLKMQGLLAQRLQSFFAQIPAIPRPQQIADCSRRSRKTEPGKDTGAQSIIASHVDLRGERKRSLAFWLEMIHLGPNSQACGMICTLR